MCTIPVCAPCLNDNPSFFLLCYLPATTKTRAAGNISQNTFDGRLDVLTLLCYTRRFSVYVETESY